MHQNVPQIVSFHLRYMMVSKVRNFVIEGVACQLPSSLRRLQATPLLQTSLMIGSIDFDTKPKKRDGLF